jgi:hypothetical protein
MTGRRLKVYMTLVTWIVSAGRRAPQVGAGPRTPALAGTARVRTAIGLSAAKAGGSVRASRGIRSVDTKGFHAGSRAFHADSRGTRFHADSRGTRFHADSRGTRFHADSRGFRADTKVRGVHARARAPWPLERVRAAGGAARIPANRARGVGGSRPSALRAERPLSGGPMTILKRATKARLHGRPPPSQPSSLGDQRAMIPGGGGALGQEHSSGRRKWWRLTPAVVENEAILRAAVHSAK